MKAKHLFASCMFPQHGPPHCPNLQDLLCLPQVFWCLAGTGEGALHAALDRPVQMNGCRWRGCRVGGPLLLLNTIAESASCYLLVHFFVNCSQQCRRYAPP